MVMAHLIGFTRIIKDHVTEKTQRVVLTVDSLDYPGVKAWIDFKPEEWSYSTMDTLMHKLTDQLSMHQDLNGSLEVRICGLNQ